MEARSDQDPPGTPPAAVPPKALFPIAGVGASAGGLRAFKDLLEALPAHPGIAFVLLPHLSPTSQSMMSSILQKSSKLPVVDVKEAQRLEPDHVYVLAPNTTLTLNQGTFHAITPRVHESHPEGIDHFLLSLAKEAHERAIGIILSGTASDGAAGIKAIKSEGGITFAQDATAEFPEMPGAAIATGCVDFVLSPAGIAAELARVAQHPYLSFSVAATGAEPSGEEFSEEATQILQLMLDRTGVEFIHYKPNTILRRIARRMTVCKVEKLSQYRDYLAANPAELRALHDDILIRVTSFFRDPESFEVLKEKIFPSLLQGRPTRLPLRIWVPGCATGEEAYSLAIALLEYLDKAESHIGVQIFASDLNDNALAFARAGRYDASIAADVSPERLGRFFTPQEDGAFQVNKRVRDLCLFAKHDLTRDPPFSRLDLLSCRNVLIYLGPVLQKRVVPYLHYSLKPGGFLMLGASESVDRFADLFSPVDRKSKIYAKSAAGLREQAFAFPTDRPTAPAMEGDRPAQSIHDPAFDLGREVNRLLLRDYVPGGLVVDEEGRVLEIRGNTGPYLHPAPGKPNFMLHKMVHEELVPEIESAMREAREKGSRIRREPVQYRVDGRLQGVAIEVRPIQGPTARDVYYIILFEEVPQESAPAGTPSKSELPVGEQVRLENERLRQALDTSREYQQSIIEKIETSNEELRSSHEEVLSSNEELQSTNEELETAKEELQSANEELTTLNEELRQRNADLAQSNSDLSNVLSSVEIPIALVDKTLRLRKLTPAAEKLFNVLPADVNRPLKDLRLGLQVEDLEGLVKRTIETLAPTERDVQDRAGRWCSLRIRPYRSGDDRIEGAVLLVVDIDEVKKDALAQAKARAFSEAVIDSIPLALLILDDQLRVMRVNDSFCSLFRVTREEAENRPVYEFGNRQWDIPALRKLLEDILPRNSRMENFEVEHEFAQVGKKTLLMHARKLTTWHTQAPVIVLAMEDISLRKVAEQEVLQVNANLERRVQDRTHELESAKAEMEAFTYSVAHDLRAPLRAMNQFSQALVEDYSKRPLDDSGLDILRRIIDSSAKMDLLIKDLLLYSRLSREEIPVQTVELAPIVNEAIRALDDEILARRAVVRIETPLPVVRGHRVTLVQALINVLSNSLKFTAPGVAPVIQVRAEKTSGKVRLWIEDNGIGIDPKYHERIFRIFERLNHSDEYPGTGIGLAIVRKAMERMKGSVGVESALGQGARFHLDFLERATR